MRMQAINVTHMCVTTLPGVCYSMGLGICMLPATLHMLCCHANIARVASCPDTSNPYLTYTETTYVEQ